MNCLGRTLLCVAVAALSCLSLFPSAHASHRDENGLSGNIRWVREELPAIAPSLPSMTRETNYATNGQIVRITSYLAAVPYSEKAYRYDDSGRLTQVSRQSAGRWFPEIAYRYSDNQLVETICYGPDGKVIETKPAPTGNTLSSACSSERSGNMTFVYRKDESGQRLLCASYEYDNANGALFRKSLYRPDGSLSAILTFDRQQHPLSISQYDTRGSLLTLEQMRYRVDENGNWIERISERFQDGQWQPAVTVKRTLSYY